MYKVLFFFVLSCCIYLINIFISTLTDVDRVESTVNFLTLLAKSCMSVACVLNSSCLIELFPTGITFIRFCRAFCHKKVREKSRECHNHKPQPILDTKRKRKQTKPNKCKLDKRTKSSSLFPKRGDRNAKRIEKYNNKITQGKT